MEIAIVLTLLVLAIIAFSTEKISVDIVTMTCVLLLVLSGIITYKEAFAPFGSDFIIMLASIFIVTSAIDSSGVLELWTSKLMRRSAGNKMKLIMPMISITGLFSSLMNNTTVTALMINPAMAIAKKSGINFSKILLPLAFASIVGGTCTLIGTSTNVAVNAYLGKNNFPVLGMWDFTWIGVIMLLVTLLYMVLLGVRMLPDRKNDELTDNYGIRSYLSEIKILPNSSLIGQVIQDSDISRMGFTVLAVIRGDRQFAPGENVSFRENDIVLVKGLMQQLIGVKNTKGIDIVADTLDFYNEKDNKLRLAEMVVPGRSNLAGFTIAESDFRRKYGFVVVAINREGKNITEQLNNIRFEVGDMLLVQGRNEAFDKLSSHHDLVLLGDHTPPVKNLWKGYFALAFFMLAIVVSSIPAFNVHVSVAFLASAVLSMLVGAVKPEDAYKNIEWKLLVLIAGMTAFGTAMANSGADKYLAGLIVDWFGGMGPMGIMAGFMVLTVLLTQPMSNAAAALVVLPVALEAAHTLDVNPLTYAVAVMLSASVSLITPFEPSCILVYGPGKYKFGDFFKVGGILTLILMVIIYLTVPITWPL
ncbi:MAG TPA: SLC13 family permease [Chitinophagales bacterium]|nr:SLC13 family permease [Chitinophagales bacterium]HNO28378.1 SLC13 family permease [Chitinophagales bacterium]